jgi:transposase
MQDEGNDVWATDEVHFQQYGSSCRMWVPPEKRNPVLRHYPGRKSVGYFGAVRLRDGKFIYRKESGKFNAQTFWDFMIQVKEDGSLPGKKMIVITDNAKYHHAKLHKEWREQSADSFALDYLPPYSPDLNPIERVWKLTRRNRLHNRYFHEIAAIEDTVEDLFDSWKDDSLTLELLCAII